MNHMQTFQQNNASGKDLSFLKPGLTVRVHQKINDGKKERIQVFEGLVIAQKHGTGLDGTVTVRKIASGVGVERTFPIHSPNIDKFEVVKAAKTRRSKLYYIREKTAKETRRKTRLLAEETKKAQEAAAAQEAAEKAKAAKPADEEQDAKPEAEETKQAAPETTETETNEAPQQEPQPEPEAEAKEPEKAEEK